jgi:hypothetical protein
MYSAAADFQLALASCNEINSAKSLYTWLVDLKKLSGGALPTKKDLLKINEPTYRKFLEGVIVCSEKDHK